MGQSRIIFLETGVSTHDGFPLALEVIVLVDIGTSGVFRTLFTRNPHQNWTRKPEYFFTKPFPLYKEDPPMLTFLLTIFRLSIIHED